MTPDTLNQEVKKNKILPFYYFYGDENFLIEDTIRTIKEKVVGSSPSGFNLHIYYANEDSPEEIINAAWTRPFLSQRKLLVVRNADGFSGKQLESFLPYLKKPTSTTCLIFVAKNADTRKKFFQELKKIGGMVQFKSLSENRMAFWIKKEVEKLAKKISPEALSFLIENTGGSLENIFHEMQKVVLYVGEKNLIEINDLEDIIVDSTTRSVFDLIFYLGNKDSKNSLKVLDKMLLNGDPPLLILTMIIRQIRLILRAKEILGQGGSFREMKKSLNVPEFTLKRLASQTKHFSFDELIKSYTYLLETDLALKSSIVSKQLILEKLIINLSRQNDTTQ